MFMVYLYVQWCIFMFNGVSSWSIVYLYVQWYISMFNSISLSSMVYFYIQWYIFILNGVSFCSMLFLISLRHKIGEPKVFLDILRTSCYCYHDICSRYLSKSRFINYLVIGKLPINYNPFQLWFQFNPNSYIIFINVMHQQHPSKTQSVYRFCLVLLIGF